MISTIYFQLRIKSLEVRFLIFAMFDFFHLNFQIDSFNSGAHGIIVMLPARLLFPKL